MLVVGDESYFLEGVSVLSNVRVQATGIVNGRVFEAESITTTGVVAGVPFYGNNASPSQPFVMCSVLIGSAYAFQSTPYGGLASM